MLIKLGDNVSTDDISPSGTAALVFRSNVPAIAEFTFKNTDADFVTRARAAGTGILVGGEIYGQGSSREAAVTAPLHLGVRAVIAKSFARIHRANLINWGIVPLEFDDAADYEGIERDDMLHVDGLRDALDAGRKITVTNERTGKAFQTRCVLTPRERDILLANAVENADRALPLCGQPYDPASRPTQLSLDRLDLFHREVEVLIEQVLENVHAACRRRLSADSSQRYHRRQAAIGVRTFRPNTKVWRSERGNDENWRESAEPPFPLV